ncbi:MAG: HDOD domain-containing protein, partial [Fibrobacterota bacterium]
MSLTLWLKKIADKEMPAFRKTAAELATASNSTEAGTEVLGRLILQDPALTARMLKLSNTAFY